MHQQAMIDHLRIGDEVLTAGGFFATVVRIDEDEVTVELSPGSEARLAKRAIAAVMPDEDETDVDETDADETTRRRRRRTPTPSRIGRAEAPAKLFFPCTRAGTT